MTLVALLGWLGNLLFIYAAAPEAYRTIKAKRALGTPIDLIVAVLVGFVVMFFYTYLSRGFDWVLAINYWLQFLIWAVLLFYRLFKNKELGIV